MIIILFAVIGAIFGAWRARSRSGNGLDIAQYAAVHAIIFGLIGLVVLIVLTRTA